MNVLFANDDCVQLKQARRLESPIGQDLTTISDRIPAASVVAGWDERVVKQLLAWRDNPSQLELEDVVPPTNTAIAVAIGLAQRYRDDGLSVPDAVVPDGNGGVVFESGTGDMVVNLEVDEHGAASVLTLKNCKVVHRERLI